MVVTALPATLQIGFAQDFSAPSIGTMQQPHCSAPSNRTAVSPLVSAACCQGRLLRTIAQSAY